MCVGCKACEFEMPSEERYSIPPSDANKNEISKPKNLRDIMSCPFLLMSFHEYCETELAIENMRFWEDVEEYKRIPEQDRMGRFLEIYERYFNPESCYELNVSSKYNGI